MNLLYSLPEVLQSEIYLFDTTHRIFGSDVFKEDLQRNYLASPYIVSRCRDCIVNYLDDTIYDGGCIWLNEYGRIDPDDDLDPKLTKYETVSDFFVVTKCHPDKEAVFFKVLPKGATPENCSFLSRKNQTNWDGYFTDDTRVDYEDDRLKKFDKLCWSGTEDHREGFGYTENTFEGPRFIMHLVC